MKIILRNRCISHSHFAIIISQTGDYRRAIPFQTLDEAPFTDSNRFQECQPLCVACSLVQLLATPCFIRNVKPPKNLELLTQ